MLSYKINDFKINSLMLFKLILDISANTSIDCTLIYTNISNKVDEGIITMKK